MRRSSRGTRAPKPTVSAPERLESRTMLYSQAVHQTLTESAVDFFLKQFGPAEVSSDRAEMGRGAFDEDGQLSNPYGDENPYFMHFWDPSRGLHDGLSFLGGSWEYDSAPGRAIAYVTGAGFTNPAFATGGLVASYDAGATGTAFGLLGRIAHLLEDMTVPAHANNDAHLEGYGILDDPDPYHDWVDGNWRNRQHVANATGNRAGAYPPSPTIPIRGPRGLSPAFVNGTTSTESLLALFRETADFAGQWASDGMTGTIPGNPFSGAGTWSSKYADWREATLNGMAGQLVPRAVTGVAELIRCFYGMVDAEAPTIEFAKLTSTDPSVPQSIRGNTIDLSVLASDAKTGDSGVGKRLFKYEVCTKQADGRWGAWTSLKGGGVPEATDVMAFGASESKALAGLHGVRLGYRFTAEEGKTYAFRVSTRDGAGNASTSEVHYVRVGGDSVDVVLVIDTTGSMDDDIEQVKKSAQAILSDLATRDPEARAGVVLYKDFGESYVTQTLVGLTTELSRVGSAIQGISVSGGGDTPEAVLSALHHAINGSDGLGAWRSGNVTKQIVLFGDAPAHDPERGGLTGGAIVKEALAGGVELGRSPASPITIQGVVTGGQ